MNPEDILEIGKIVGVHGIRGQVKLYSYAESTDPFRPGKAVTIKRPDGSYRAYTVQKVQPYKNMLRMAFEEIDSRDAAEAVVGSAVFVSRSALPEPEPDTWYWCDLIGLDVYAGERGFIGQVASMIETGSNDVFVVRNNGGETLIPAIDSIVIDIDIAANTMRVALPEGL